MKNTKMKWQIIKIIAIVLFAFGLFYVLLPAINFKNPDFYYYLSIVCIFSFIVSIPEILFFKGFKNITEKKPKNAIVFLVIFLIIIVGPTVINFFASPLFNADSYGNRIEINDKNNFVDDVKPVSFNSLPLLDKDSSQKLGDRVMGQMPELVSQYRVSNLYTQINYNEDIIRVTPLEYADIIKYFTNRKNGIQGYITVNSVNGEAKLIKLTKGMKYVPSAMFGEDLYRHLRFSYPTLIFGTETFEIDNEGNPSWIVPILNYAGVGLKESVTGVIVVNPISGEMKRYNVNEIPSWIDHVYPSELIISQVNDWGKYQGGFFNSIFGQKGVVQTTTGYNYSIINDDVYLYTGITSTSSDESNLGFILTNLRTKETNFYSVPGAEEYSAMASAEGQVQQMKYTSTFPLLINLNNRPTYLVSLKDAAGLVKMYAFVDVVDYQKVVVTDSSLGIERAKENYLNNVDLKIDEETKETKEITIIDIKPGIIEGSTYYYIIDNDSKKYKVNINISEKILPFLKKGDQIIIIYIPNVDLNIITEVR